VETCPEADWHIAPAGSSLEKQLCCGARITISAIGLYGLVSYDVRRHTQYAESRDLQQLDGIPGPTN
jgi:hypothetical protein